MIRNVPIRDLPQMLDYCRKLRGAPACVTVPASLYRDLISEATKAAFRRGSPLTQEEMDFLRSECASADRLGVNPTGNVYPHAAKLYRLAGFLDASPDPEPLPAETPDPEPLEPTAQPTAMESNE